MVRSLQFAPRVSRRTHGRTTLQGNRKRSSICGLERHGNVEMSPSPSSPSIRPARAPPPSAPPDLAHALRRDLVLWSAFLGSGLLVSFQLAVFLLQPSWRTAVTDWLRTGLAWPEMLTLGLVAAWCMRTHHP